VQIIVETDAMAVVQAVYSSTYDLSATMVNLVAELRRLLSLNFNSWRVQHRPRESNRVAHALAALGSACSMDDDPNFFYFSLGVQSVIADDSSSYE
jgi:hypothetical protein